MDSKPPQTARHLSLDVLRGIVILSMIFVSTLENLGLKNIPAMLIHAPDHANWISFADLVFPSFIFMMGMSMPFAIGRMMDAGSSVLEILKHIAVRGGTLLFLGVVVMNSQETYSAGLSKMSFELWSVIASAGILLFWIDTSKTSIADMKWLRRGIKIAGLIIIAAMLAIFRGQDENGQTIWLITSWWGILGMIGWAYMISSLLFLITRGNTTALAGSIGMMIAFYIGAKHGSLGFIPEGIYSFFNMGEMFGSHASIAVAGVLAACLLRVGNDISIWKTSGKILALGLMLFTAGQLIRPLHGANKVDGTDAYCLICAGIACMSFVSVHLAVNLIPLIKKPAEVIGTIGRNALFAYFFSPAITYAAIELHVADYIWCYAKSGGFFGCLNVLVVMCVIFTGIYFITNKGFVIKI